MHTYNSCQLSSKEIIGMVNIGKVWVHKIHAKLRLLKYREVDKVEIITSEEEMNSNSDINMSDVNFKDNVKIVKKNLEKENSKTNTKSINVFNLKM
jgi:hypothetical protein